uniref:Uncharacterized protein n=1 Tax=Cacopsylla melanoneura TaxID=428564 RepID=A0A8D8RD70_9HEMI
MVEPKYLNLSTVLRLIPSRCTVSPFSTPKFNCTVLALLILRPFSSKALRHFSNSCSTSPALSPHNTTSSANSMHPGASRRTPSVNTSMTTSNRYGLRADPW